MLTFLVAAVVAASSPQVEVKPLAAPSVSGALVQLAGDKVVVASGDGESREFNLAELRTITLKRAPSGRTAKASAGDVQIQLTDGSLLLAESFKLEKGRATVAFGKSSGADESFEFSARAIHWVRLDAHRQPPVDQQWAEVLGAEWNGDILVARRQTVEEVEVNGGTTERATVALDPYEGLLRGVTSSNAIFEIDDEQFTPSLEKLAGFIFRQQPSQRTSPAVCALIDGNGSRWSVQSLRLVEETIEFKTVAGIERTLPLADVASFDFAGANIVYLSDLTPESNQWTPFIASSAGGEKLAELFSFRRDKSLDGGPLRLDGVQYDKGLGIHSRTELVYRVPEGFQRFRAIVGINDRVRHLGKVQLVITGDQNVLYEQNVQSLGDKERTPPAELDIDVSGVRRLKILVDFGGGLLDVADHLDLCDARFTK